MASSTDNSLVKVAILDDYQGVGLSSADWTPLQSKVHVTVFRDTLHAENDLVQRLLPFQVVCAMRERTKFTSSLLSQLPNLRLIASTGMKNRGIDIKAAKERGIVVSGTGATGNSTLEHIWALILATARYVVSEHVSTQAANPQWQNAIPIGLSGKTLGLVGLGRLGQSTAQIAKAFNMKVLAWSPHLTRERADAAGVDFASSKSELFKFSDIVSIQMVLSPETKGMVTLEDLKHMKPTALLINTSRGPLVDEAALCEVLRDGKIAGAGLDVFDVEPLPLDHPLRKLPNVTLSPHLGYVADDAYKVFWEQTVENIHAFLAGSPKRELE